jgi:hypothetical protein
MPDLSCVVLGKVVALNNLTGWGEAVYDLTVVPFHVTSMRRWHREANVIGQPCNLIFNQGGDLLSVELL